MPFNCIVSFQWNSLLKSNPQNLILEYLVRGVWSRTVLFSSVPQKIRRWHELIWAEWIFLSIGPVIFVFKGSWGAIFHFYSHLNRTLCKQTEKTDQMLHSAASDLGLHCLPVSHKMDARLIWVKEHLLGLKNGVIYELIEWRIFPFDPLYSDGFPHTCN